MKNSTLLLILAGLSLLVLLFHAFQIQTPSPIATGTYYISIVIYVTGYFIVSTMEKHYDKQT